MHGLHGIEVQPLRRTHLVSLDRVGDGRQYLHCVWAALVKVLDDAAGLREVVSIDA